MILQLIVLSFKINICLMNKLKPTTWKKKHCLINKLKPTTLKKLHTGMVYICLCTFHLISFKKKHPSLCSMIHMEYFCFFMYPKFMLFGLLVYINGRKLHAFILTFIRCNKVLWDVKRRFIQYTGNFSNMMHAHTGMHIL